MRAQGKWTLSQLREIFISLLVWLKSLFSAVLLLFHFCISWILPPFKSNPFLYRPFLSSGMLQTFEWWRWRGLEVFSFVISSLNFVITNRTTFLICSFVSIPLADNLLCELGFLINHLDNQMSLAICSV